MPVTKSAKKALRVSKRKRIRNLRLLRNIRNATKNLKQAILSNDSNIQVYFSKAQKAIDKALKVKYISKNKAARKKSQLARLLKSKV